MKKPKLNTITRKLCITAMAIGMLLCLFFSLVLYPIIYNILKNNAVDNVIQLSYQTNNQIDSIIERMELYKNFINSDEYLYNLILEHQADGTLVYEEKIASALTGSLNYFKHISNIIIFIEDGMPYSILENYLSEDMILNSEWFKDYINNGYSRQFSGLTDFWGDKTEDEEYPFQFIAYPYDNKSLKGHIVFQFPFELIKNVIHTYSENGMDVVLVGRDNEPIYKFFQDESKGIDLEQIKKLLENTSTESVYVTENKGGVDIVTFTKYGGLKLVVNITDYMILGQFVFILYLIYFFQLLLILAFMLSMMLTISRRLKPLRFITAQMDKINDENINIQIDMKTGDEFEKLAHSYNQMIYRIQASIEERKRRSQIEKKMEYALMVAQIDPHFIYKTLNIITYLANEKENEKLINVNESLIDILQDRLRISKIDVLDTIRKELEIIDAYICIQKVRYEDLITYKCEIEEEMLDYSIPKNIIQPLIENAIFHGILLNMDSGLDVIGGTIFLKIYREDHKTVIQVTDNGPGMTDEKISEYLYGGKALVKEKGKHIGLNNIKQRLAYIYGDSSYIFDIKSIPGDGTTVIIKIGGEDESK